jgi:hypothetical protein
MAWLWTSWKEFLDYVQPALVNRRGLFNLAQRNTTFENDGHLTEAVREITEAQYSLSELGFKGRDYNVPPSEQSVSDEAKRVVIDLIHAGEELLLYHKRLATSDSAYGFLHQHDLLEHWERYIAAGNLSREIDQLVTDTSELLLGYHQLKDVDDRFLTCHSVLPPELEADFLLARNLFSVGFEEVGVLITGRGLEGVLRKIAQRRKVMIEVRGKVEPASEADVSDLIEVMFRIRWKATGTRLIEQETRALLHYLRTLRNAGAHPHHDGQQRLTNSREIASIVVETANRLWKDVTGTRARFYPTTIQKTW